MEAEHKAPVATEGTQPSDSSAASASTSAFECEGVALGFDGQSVLEGVDVTVANREFLTIVGGSGVGKTTLLRALGGLIRPSAGTIRARGEEVETPPPDVLIVFQDYSNSLLPWRTVEGNVSLGLEAMGIEREDRPGRIEEALQLVDLGNAKGKFPWQLSGGMQQRLQLARALALRPSSLLMDEPFGSLDAITKATLQDELQKVHSSTGATIVFITHDVEEAVYLGDRAIVLAGAPATITLELEIDLPRPRDQLTTREMPRFLELRHALFEAIQKGGARGRDEGI